MRVTGTIYGQTAELLTWEGSNNITTIGTLKDALTIKKTTVGSNIYEDTNPKIIFKNSNESQNVSLTFTDYDSVQSPASLTLNGSQGGEYFIAPNIKATSQITANKINGVLQYQAGNELNFGGAIPSEIWFNYKNAETGNKSGTNTNVKYYFGNGNGATSTATVIANNFTGNLTGTASNLSNFKVTTTTNLWAVDSPTQNAVGYQNGLTKAAWNYQQADGATYVQFYSSSWIHEIFGDYRTGQISVRGKNNGTWQSWRRILDETNGASILGLKALAYKDSLTKSDVGLGNVNNQTITVTSTSVSDGTNTFSKYTHPTTAGNKHIPAGGSSGQFLGYDSAGTAKWVANPNTDKAVLQSTATANKWRKVTLGEQYEDNLGAAVVNKTSQVYVNPQLEFNTSTGVLNSTKFLVNKEVTLEYNSTTESLDFVF